MTEQNKDPQEPAVLKGKDDTYNPSNAISLAEANAAEFIPATDINEFSTLVVGWHTAIVNQGYHLLSLDNQNPNDPQKVQIHVHEPGHPNADENGYRVLEDSELVAFKHGARWMLNLFEDLPFQYVPTDADNNPSPGYEDPKLLDEQE